MGKRKSFLVPHVVVVAVAMIHNIKLQDVANQKDRNNNHTSRLTENI